jgi:anaerobic ribonucleoside-triphosphate reductase
METIKYTTRIKGNKVFLPDAILQKIDQDRDIEILFRPLTFSVSTSINTNQIIEEITDKINKKYKNLNIKVNKKLKALAGISSNINKKYLKYSDDEILAMERMKKHMEPGEIVESLY